MILRNLLIVSILAFTISCSTSGENPNDSGDEEEIEVRPKHSRIENIEEEEKDDVAENENISSSTIKMIPVNGVYQIPVLINGVQMSFIFDTGASIISISATEALFLLKQGKLTKEDIIGTENFSDANGDISEGTIIMLKSVKIGKNELHNIKASVVLNLSAPLLMGQSALSQFGKISIDNNTKEITFE